MDDIYLSSVGASSPFQGEHNGDLFGHGHSRYCTVFANKLKEITNFYN